MAQRKRQARPTVKVVRDSTFHRAVADKGIAIDLGRDVEFAFLQGGPIVTGVIDVDETREQIKLEGSYSEVARIRMSVPAGLALCMNFMEALVRGDKVKVEAVTEAIHSWSDQATSASISESGKKNDD